METTPVKPDTKTHKVSSGYQRPLGNLERVKFQHDGGRTADEGCDANGPHPQHPHPLTRDKAKRPMGHKHPPVVR